MSRKKWSDEKLFFRLLNNKSDKTYWENIEELRSRMSKSIFEKSLSLSLSESSKHRKIGIDILAQLGGASRPYKKQSVTRFFELVNNETDSEVLSSLLLRNRS